ncbi:hypothetical protein K9U41_23565, partial [Xanthobacter autotrophicus]|nr:hypothetical protein [Xanthobacter autotrophicus]
MQDQIIQALRQNEADQAVQLAQAWTRDEPGQAEAHRWLALALQQQGKAEDAMEALQQALQRAGWAADEVDYVNLHGTATGHNDAMESLAVSQVLGNQVPASSTKPLTGHTLGASGAIEAALCW